MRHLKCPFIGPPRHLGVREFVSALADQRGCAGSVQVSWDASAIGRRRRNKNRFDPTNGYAPATAGAIATINLPTTFRSRLSAKAGLLAHGPATRHTRALADAYGVIGQRAVASATANVCLDCRDRPALSYLAGHRRRGGRPVRVSRNGSGAGGRRGDGGRLHAAHSARPVSQYRAADSQGRAGSAARGRCARHSACNSPPARTCT